MGKCERISREEYGRKEYIDKKSIYDIRQQYCSRFGLTDFAGNYIVVQQTTTVSLTGLTVLRTLYKPMYMIKLLTVEIVNFVFYKSCSF